MAQGDSKFAFQDGGGLDAAPTGDYHAGWKAFAVRRNLALLLLGGGLDSVVRGAVRVDRAPSRLAGCRGCMDGLCACGGVVGGRVSLPAMSPALCGAGISQGVESCARNLR